MTPAERRLLAGLAESLKRRMTRKVDGVYHWPEPLCGVGQWRDGRPGPCSPKCAQDRERLEEAAAMAAEQPGPVQLGLLEAS
jgi:hypothetical protein